MTNDISLAPPAGFIPAVTEFKGTLGEVNKLSKTSKRTGNAYEVVSFEFGDLEVIEATSPIDESQPFIIELFYSEDRANTVWDEFRKTLVPFLPDEAGGNIGFFSGYRFHMQFGDIMLNQRDDATGKWGVSKSRGWIVVDVEGLTNNASDTVGTINDYIAENIANGKNEADATQAFYADEKVRSLPGYQDAVNALAAGNLFTNLLAEDLITEDIEGKFVFNG